MVDHHVCAVIANEAQRVQGTAIIEHRIVVGPTQEGNRVKARRVILKGIGIITAVK